MATKIQKLGKVCSPDHPQSVSVGASLALVQGVALEGTHMGLSFLAEEECAVPTRHFSLTLQGVTDERMEGRFFSLLPYVG